MYVCMHVCMYVCIHACMDARMHACMQACMDGCMHACISIALCIFLCMSLQFDVEIGTTPNVSYHVKRLCTPRHIEWYLLRSFAGVPPECKTVLRQKEGCYDARNSQVEFTVTSEKAMA